VICDHRKEQRLRAERAKHNLQIKARKLATEAVEKLQGRWLRFLTDLSVVPVDVNFP